MNKNILIAIFTTLLFFNIGNAQKFDLGEYDMEVIEVFNRNNVGPAFTGKKKKYVGIKVILSPKSKKNKGFDLDLMRLNSDGEEFELFYKRALNVHLRPGITIRMRQPKEIMIFAEVDKNLSSGNFTYNGKVILNFEVNNDSKIGTYVIL